MTKKLRTEMGWSTADKIVVRGRDLPGELLGKIDLGDMAWLELTGRMPTKNESRMFNAMLVTLVEHGVTPSAIVARMTYLGAPEAMQAAVAAGLCGLGSVFVGSTEGCARMLMENRDVKSILEKYKHIPGLGHPIHKPVDPRSVKLFEIARECGFYGPYCELIQALAKEKELVLNATGAIGAICCEMKLDWKAVRGLGVMARAVGLVGHLLEESREPMAAEIWHRIEAEATEHHKR